MSNEKQKDTVSIKIVQWTTGFLFTGDK